MIGSIIGLMAAAIAASSEPAAANLPAADSVPASSAPAPAKIKKIKDPGDKIVCHDDAMTGSHLGGVQICKKQKEWDAITTASKHMLDTTNHGGVGYKPGGG